MVAGAANSVFSPNTEWGQIIFILTLMSPECLLCMNPYIYHLSVWVICMDAFGIFIVIYGKCCFLITVLKHT